MKIISYSIFGFVLFLTFAGISDKRTPQQKKEARCNDKIMAFIMSQTFVKKALKSPSSAVFPSYSDSGVAVKRLGGCKHGIRAHVDSQNGFGAMIRTKYTARVVYVKSSDAYRLEDISIR